MAIIVHLVALHVSQAFFRNLAKRGGSTKITEKDLKKKPGDKKLELRCVQKGVPACNLIAPNNKK